MKQLTLKISAPYVPGHRFTMLEQGFRKAFYERFGVWVNPKYDPTTKLMDIQTVPGEPLPLNFSMTNFITGFEAAVAICRLIDQGAIP